MLRVLMAGWFLLGAAGLAMAEGPAPLSYEVSFQNAVHHEARITVSLSDIGMEPLVLRMSRSSPGRYALHEFAKNVYAVEAVDGEGRALTVRRTDPYSWIVDGHDGKVRVSYTLYADWGDGTYSQIDSTHARLNMPATFMWAQGFEDRPVEVTFHPLDKKWKVATQLRRTRRKMTFRARNLDYFMDSPTEISAYDMRSWKIGVGKSAKTIRLVVHHDGIPEDVDILAAKTKKVVAEEVKIFGEPAPYDYGEYTFLADYLPYIHGDGMEHRNSTIVASTESLYEADFRQLGTIAHEFFHSWNVERLRPEGLEPFDFTRANPTPSLWFAEGFTSYYGPLAMRRAGESSNKEYLEQLARNLTYVVYSPGRAFASPQNMSLQAPFVDAARSIDSTNFTNTFISYYPYGAVVALALDLSIRQKFEGLTLDDYMRRMWKTHGKTEIPYTPEDLREGLAAAVGDAKFADDFFTRYVEKSELPDFGPLLAQAGFKLERTRPKKASLGPVSFTPVGRSMIIAQNTVIGSPLYKAGLERGDEIVRVGRFRIDSEAHWQRAVDRHKPGDTVTIEFIQRGQTRKAEATFGEDMTMSIKPYEDADLELTDAQKAFREAWLGPDVEPEEE